MKAFSGDDGHPIFTGVMYEPSFRGGINMSLGDAMKLGYDQLVVGTGRGGAPRSASTICPAVTSQIATCTRLAAASR